MTRRMYDAVTASNIPRSAEMVAGYVNGKYRWSDTDWALFPSAVHVGIAVRASYNGGDVLDVERGDATPVEAPGWVYMRRQAKADPSVYCSESVWATVENEFFRQGVAVPHWWIARYDANPNPNIPNGAVAKQYLSTPGYDVSSVADFWPGVDNGGSMTISGADAQLVVNTLMSDWIEVGPEDGPTHTVQYSALLRLMDDHLSVLRNLLTEDNVKQWIRDVMAEHISVTGTVQITGV